jgi:hypothetical protein
LVLGYCFPNKGLLHARFSSPFDLTTAEIQRLFAISKDLKDKFVAGRRERRCGAA